MKRRGRTAPPRRRPISPRATREVEVREPDETDDDVEQEDEEEEDDDREDENVPQLEAPEPPVASLPSSPPPPTPSTPLEVLRNEVAARLEQLGGAAKVTIDIERIRPPDGFLARLEGDTADLVDQLKPHTAREWGGGDYVAEIRLGGTWVGQKRVPYKIGGPSRPIRARPEDALDGSVGAAASPMTPLEEMRAKVAAIEARVTQPSPSPGPSAETQTFASIVSTAINALAQKAQAAPPTPASSPEIQALTDRLEAAKRENDATRAKLEEQSREMRDRLQAEQFKAVNRQLSRMRKDLARAKKTKTKNKGETSLGELVASFEVVEQLKKKISQPNLKERLDRYVGSLIDHLPAPEKAAEEIRRQAEPPPPMPARGGDEEAAFRAWTQATLNHYPKSLEASRLREALERWPAKTRRFGSLRTREELVAFAREHGSAETVAALEQLPNDQLAALVARIEAIDKALAAVATASQGAAPAPGS